MATEEERRALHRAIAQQKKTEKSNTLAKAPTADRKAMWSKAMKAAASSPRVRVEGD